MDFSIDTLISQLWPLAIAGLILSVIIRKGPRKGTGKTTDFRQAPTNLSGNGVSYPAADSLADGNLRYTGATHGIPWFLETVNLDSEVDDGNANRRTTAERWTRWYTSVGNIDLGAALLMNLPNGSPPLDMLTKGGGGLIATIVDKAASVALSLYVRQRFGPERAAATNLEPDQRQLLGHAAFDHGYAVWCSNPKLCGRLSGQILDDLVAAHPSGVAVLWDRSGLMLHWPQAVMDAATVEAYADLGSRLACLLTGREARIAGPAGT